MSEEYRLKGRQYATFLETLSAEEIERGNAAVHRQAQDEHRRFSEQFELGRCYLCSRPLNSFSKKLPCAHWLLKPKGFRKKDLLVVAQRYGFFQLESYLRWVANRESFARNINDLPQEGSGSKLFELTIRYRNLEWAFSCAEADYQGHATSQHAKHAHYHLQMRVDRRSFINYSDFHLPFSEMDIVNIEAMRADGSKLRQRHSFGEGMATILNDDLLENVLNSPSNDATEEDAVFKFDSMVVADQGTSISGNDLADLIEDAKRAGVTIASLLHRLPNASTRVLITPGAAVVEQAPRRSRNGDSLDSKD